MCSFSYKKRHRSGVWKKKKKSAGCTVPADRTEPRTSAAGCREPKRAAPSWSPGSDVSVNAETHTDTLEPKRRSTKTLKHKFLRGRLVTEYLPSAQSNQCFLAGSSFDFCQRLLMANCEGEVRRKRGKSGHLRQKNTRGFLKPMEETCGRFHSFVLTVCGVQPDTQRCSPDTNTSCPTTVLTPKTLKTWEFKCYFRASPSPRCQGKNHKTPTRLSHTGPLNKYIMVSPHYDYKQTTFFPLNTIDSIRI